MDYRDSYIYNHTTIEEQKTLNGMVEAAQYVDTYIFKSYNQYEKALFGFIMEADRIDTSDEAFGDILYDLKRRNISDNLAKIVTSNNIVLAISKGKSLPKAFKVFAAKDIKRDKNKIKVFIDVTDCITYKNGKYVCSKIEWLVSYIIDAMVSYIYAVAPSKLTGNSSILKDGGLIWSNLFTYVVDRMYKISAVQSIRQSVHYLSAIFYQTNILMKNFDQSIDSIKANAERISNIDPKIAGRINPFIEAKDFINLSTFCECIGKILDLKDFKPAAVIALWMNVFGTGTVFGLEYFPAFSAMMTDTYVGGYINNQLTIEKIAGPSLVDFNKTIFQIGASVS